jgi:hypothetical protein
MNAHQEAALRHYCRFAFETVDPRFRTLVGTIRRAATTQRAIIRRTDRNNA